MVTAAASTLKGVRVVDFTRFVSGSFAGQLLAGMGAEVLKIEVPPDGDPYRSQGAVRIGGDSVLFMTLNSGKKSVAIDFRSPSAAAHVERLLGSADVMLENARPGSLERYRLDYASVHARHPRIVYGSISGFGDVGPDAGRGGFDLILQAESGLMSVTGHPETGPAKVGAPVTDIGAGLTCVAGVTAALFERTRTGVGRHVSTSLLEFALSSLSTLATATFAGGEVPALLGTHSPTFAPYGAFEASDGWIALAGAGSDEIWVRLCAALDRQDLPVDRRFADNGSRVRNRAELNTAIGRQIRTGSVDHWLTRLEAGGVPSARIVGLEEAFATPQVEALQMVEHLTTASGEMFATVAAPMRIDGTRPRISHAAPRLGEHTREVLTALGTSGAELDQLGAVGLVVV